MDNKNQNIPVLAIDGPSASGKGTVAQRVARALGFHYLDSGALYRLVALAAMYHGVALDEEAPLAALADTLDVAFDHGDVWLEGARAGDEMRSEQCGAGASRVAVFPAVRQALLARQRAFRLPPGLVADGRDMGSTVFPDAALKVYLTASAEQRARRRYKQLIEKGMHASLEYILQDINQRDARDQSRHAAPLQICGDASFLDTSSLAIEEVVAEVLARYQAVASHSVT